MIYYIVVRFRNSFLNIANRILAFFYKKCMKECGINVCIMPISSEYRGLRNLCVGNNTVIPMGAVLYCTNAELKIGSKVIFGPHPTIITGDHRIDVIGRFIKDSYEKLPQNDLPVVIEDDVWAGANIVILKGVRIGRGSVIAAGAIVNKSCPAYSIIGGCPAKILKYRFTVEQILEHEKRLYTMDQRLTKEEIELQRLNN